MVLTICGEQHDLWRALDQAGNILDMLVQHQRDKQAAKRFFRTLLKGWTYVPPVIITDTLRSYGAAQRERRLQGFKSPAHAQRFLAAYGPIAQHFRPRRHLFTAPKYRQDLAHRFRIWREITDTARAA